MPLYFNTGHKIGKPSPLFSKIEQSRLDELRAKYGGQQEVPLAEQQFNNSADVEKAIQIQGEKVRTLKGNKTEKSVLEPEIAILLKLKKDLTSLLEKEKNAKQANQPVDAATQTKDLEEQINKQGEKVRNLKATGDKTIWQPEVEVLLKLKKQLASLSGTQQPISGKKKK